MSQTILHHLLITTDRFPQLPALRYYKKRQWLDTCWKDYLKQIAITAQTLKKMDIAPSSRVAILSNTRMEWSILDFAIMALGGITVPIYPSSRSEEVMYILNDCQAKVLICENSYQLEKWQSIARKCPSIEHVIVLQPKNDELWIDSLKEHANCNFIPWLEQSIQKLSMSDIATIIYTSGTTGLPKGVVLSHRQIISEVGDLFKVMNVSSQDITLSFLPYAHVMGRVEHWGSVYAGYTLAFAQSIERLRNNLIDIRPTFIIGVPRIFEKIYSGILTKVEHSRTQLKIFNWALSVGKQVSYYKTNQQPLPLALKASYRLAQKLVFYPLKEKLGGRLRFAISGGAPLNRDIAEFFHAADLLILEGYGLTETTAAITINTPEDYCFGTVGKPLADVQLKFAEDGEIYVASQKIMVSYYSSGHDLNKLPEHHLDAQGFMPTGDIGHLTPDGFLKITDRKKDLIKTSGGKYVAPQKLENLLAAHKLISNTLICGDKKKYIVALITLDETASKEYAKQNKISFQNFAALTQNEQITDLVKEAVKHTNQNLASYETIKNFSILPREFSLEEGELTPSLKVKRKYCEQKFQNIIDSLYS